MVNRPSSLVTRGSDESSKDGAARRSRSKEDSWSRESMSMVMSCTMLFVLILIYDPWNACHLDDVSLHSQAFNTRRSPLTRH